MPTELSTGTSAIAELREQAAQWRFLHDLFRFPDARQWAWLNEPWVAEAWRRLASTAAKPHPLDLPRPGEPSEYEQAFIAAFEVGLPDPPCPLIESHWNRTGPAPEVLHENLLFFRRFGLELRSSANEPADHLRHQLEFLCYLCGLEADLRGADDADRAAQIALGREEFLDRHVRCWLPPAAAVLRRMAPDEWPAQWMSLLAELVAPSA
ncbi:MAG: hypothetical protein FJX74_02500 [Armatimonadetes bacterium]|nr:hypothetical protein [Armatimonadota bacterium]